MNIFVNMWRSKKNESTNLVEVLILSFIWLIVFASPVIAWNGVDPINWVMIFDIWAKLLPFFLLSLLNHFVLIPFLFFRKMSRYFAVAGVTIIIFSFSVFFFRLEPDRGPMKPDNWQMSEEWNPGPDQGPPPNGRMDPHGNKPGNLPPYLENFLIALLILGCDTGMRSIFRGSKVLKEKELLEKEKVKSELAFLRNQISPHFFMNTLNNIHSLIDLDTEEAKNAVIRLSKLMQHLLYDSALDTIPLKNEIAFIQSYIELMKLRFTEKVKITLDIHADLAETQIPPMLFTSLLENAFKYGISYKQKSFIDISLVTEGNKLIFKISNSIILGNKQIQEPENSGIGLENTRKRLNLLYADNFIMDISENDEVFNVKLILPI